jgi:putative glutathione S-transferase
MGLLIDGVWRDQRYDTKSTGGAFKRQASQFRNWVTPDGAPGPSGDGGFAAESGRYHLYVSHACPWANRTMIFRSIKGLEDHVGVSVVHPDMLGEGWTFDTDFDGATGDTLFGSSFMREIYQRADPSVTTRVTVPVLWDTETGRIVSNESAEIIRMFNSAFDGITGNTLDFYPEELRDRIDEINARVYSDINNGVYKSGFATSQAPMTRPCTRCSRRSTGSRTSSAENRYLAGDRDHRGRLAAVHDAGALRFRLPPAFQVQPAAADRLSQPLGLHARAVPMAGRGRDRPSRPHRAALPLQPRKHQSAPDHPHQSRDRLVGTPWPRGLEGRLRRGSRSGRYNFGDCPMTQAPHPAIMAAALMPQRPRLAARGRIGWTCRRGSTP